MNRHDLIGPFRCPQHPVLGVDSEFVGHALRNRILGPLAMGEYPLLV